MITLALPFHRKAKVWVGEQPAAVYVAERSVKHVLEAKPSFSKTVHRGAVELCIPTGPRSIYGLLGAEFNQDESDKIRITVNISSDRGQQFVASLAGTSDDVRIGLPEEYVNGVLGGVTLAREQIGHLLSGDLVFNCAAHGLTGSSELIFKYASSIVLNILILNNDEWTADELAPLFQLRF